MPSIKDAIQKNAQRIAAGGDLVQPAAKDVGPKSADGPFISPASPVVTGLPVRGAYPPNISLHTDFQNNTAGFRSGPNMRSAMFPPQQTSSSSIVTKIATAAASVAASLIIKVNNVLAPNQSVINFLNGFGIVLTNDAAGNLTITSTSAGDGLTHSTAPWESDPAYIFLRDDFTHIQASSSATIPIQGIGQLGWNLNGQNGAHGGQGSSVFPIMGTFFWDNNGAQNQVGWLNLPQNGQNGASTGTQWGWPLFDSPGWQMTWIFRLAGSAPSITGGAPFGQKSMYIGLAGSHYPTSINSVPAGRPDTFFGVRYDTSGYQGPIAGGSYGATAVTQSGSNMAITGTFTGANQTTGTTWVGLWFTVSGAGNAGNNGVFKCTAATTTTLTLTNPNGVNATVQTITCKAATPMVLTAAANGNGTQVVYTGTIFSPVNNNFVGQLFYVSGFGNSGNNGGPWRCNANTTTTITLANTVSTGSAETHAGYVGGPIINDSQLVLEAVQNPSYSVSDGPNYTQGTTLATGITPSISDTYHRLDVICNTTGQISLTLDGSVTLNAAVTAPTITITGTGLNGSVAQNQLLLNWTVTNGTIAGNPWGPGSKVTVTGFSGTQAGFDGTFPVLSVQDASHLIFNYSAAVTTAGASVNGTLSGYPGVFPTAIYGNDNANTVSLGTGSVYIDFFSFVWNPNLGPNAPGTPTSTLPRYW